MHCGSIYCETVNEQNRDPMTSMSGGLPPHSKSHAGFIGRNAQVVLRSSPQITRLPSMDVARMDQAEDEFNAQLDVPEFHPEKLSGETSAAPGSPGDLHETTADEMSGCCRYRGCTLL